MLPTLVIGLREGLEAALIVGIVAAFLRANGRLDLLKWVWTGVAAAVVLCLGVGVALKVASENLPYRQQEGLETVIALVAVAMVTYMVVWMKRHARGMRAQLESAASSALDSGSAWALVAMAFLAVVREGFETAVFLVAAFNESDEPHIAATGAVIGVLVACGVGYGIYQGGLRLNLTRFFTITGVVLVFVAAGLVASALHSAHEADWISTAQQQAFDLTWLIEPGSVQSSLLTGVLGLQPRPTVIEIVGWAVFLVPVLAYVLWPAGRPLPRRVVLVGLGATTVTAAVAAFVVGAGAPDRPDTAAPAELATAGGTLVVDVAPPVGGAMSARLSGDALGAGDASADVTLTAAGPEVRAGRDAVAYRSEPADVAGTQATHTASLAEVAQLNGGRLPLGVNADTDPGDVEVTTGTRQAITIWLDDDTGLVLDAEVATTARTVAALSVGPLPLGAADETVVAASQQSATARGELAAADADAIDRAERSAAWERFLIAVAVAAGAGAAAVWFAGRRTGGARDTPVAPSGPVTASLDAAAHPLTTSAPSADHAPQANPM